MVYRAAVIGCGKIGSEFSDDPKVKDIYTHIEAYRACPDTELVAVCDIDRKKLDSCGNKWSIQLRYTDYRKMIDEINPDIISICTPDPTHYPIIRSILESSDIKAVFAEKPLAGTVHEAEELVRVARQKQILLAVNYSRRYSTCFIQLKKALQSGSFGGVQAVSGYYTKGTLNNGTHWIDLARFLVGEIVNVHGYDVIREDGTDPSLDLRMEFAHGAVGYLHACDATKFSIFEMDIIGSRARVCIRDSGHSVEIYSVGESTYYSGYKSLIHDTVYAHCMNDMIVHAVEDITECIRTGKTPRCSGEDGLKAMTIASMARESAASNLVRIAGR